MVLELDVVNTTGAPLTFTATNLAGTAWINFSIAANFSLMTYRSQLGKKLVGGLVWSASGPGLVGSAILRTQWTP